MSTEIISSGELMDFLGDLSEALQDLELKGELLEAKNRMVKNISLILNLMVFNELKKGTVALRNAVERLEDMTKALKSEKEKYEKGELTLNKVSGVLGSINSIIQFT